MDFIPSLNTILAHTITHKIIMALVFVVAFYILGKLLNRAINNVSQRHAAGDLRRVYVTRIINIGLTFCGFMVVCFIFGLGFSEISVFLSSIFAVVGIALFAQWSILSNITASMLIFFGFPYKIGDHIRIVDKDDDISGVIVEISMFHVIIRRANGDLINYPNSIILQKAVIKIESIEPDVKTDENDG
jgi:small-conductance mechanosensitive channel